MDKNAGLFFVKNMHQSRLLSVNTHSDKTFKGESSATSVKRGHKLRTNLIAAVDIMTQSSSIEGIDVF